MNQTGCLVRCNHAHDKVVLCPHVFTNIFATNLLRWLEDARVDSVWNIVTLNALGVHLLHAKRRHGDRVDVLLTQERFDLRGHRDVVKWSPPGGWNFLPRLALDDPRIIKSDKQLRLISVLRFPMSVMHRPYIVGIGFDSPWIVWDFAVWRFKF